MPGKSGTGLGLYSSIQEASKTTMGHVGHQGFQFLGWHGTWSSVCFSLRILSIQYPGQKLGLALTCDQLFFV